MNGWFLMTTARSNSDLKQEWPAIMREDGRRVEIICPHGVGHPVKSLSRNWNDKHDGIHGCDGCCSKAIFALAEIAHQKKVA